MRGMAGVCGGDYGSYAEGRFLMLLFAVTSIFVQRDVRGQAGCPRSRCCKCSSFGNFGLKFTSEIVGLFPRALIDLRICMVDLNPLHSASALFRTCGKVDRSSTWKGRKQ